MRTQRSRTRARRRVIRRRRQVATGGLLLCCALMVMAGTRIADALTEGRDATATSNSPVSVNTARPTPVRATGEYTRAPGATDRQGSGTLMTYRVEVETGTAQDEQAFAAVVDPTLADPSSWTSQGRWSFQRVADDDVDFVIRLATPVTVDKVCASTGLDTRGYVSCRSGQFVMINLDRWMGAVPEFSGNIALYRQYVINHEVGHQLGYSHQACPGPGRLAPVMQQQTFGLDGCLKNGWPYVEGELVSGPATA